MSGKNRRAILVPVKDLTNAKTRLTELLSPEERHGLAWAMLEGVLEEVSRVEDGWDKVVVTNYTLAARMAEGYGFRVLLEEQQNSESESVDRSGAELQAEGIEGILRIPLDLPLFHLTALKPIFAGIDEGAQAVLVPSRDYLGTNALYRSPPTLFPSSFGHDSLVKHEAAARKEGVEPLVLPVDLLSLDIDDPADLAELIRRGTPCPALDFLYDQDVPDRLAEAQNDST